MTTDTDTIMKFGFEYETMLLFPRETSKRNLKKLIFDIRSQIPSWDRQDFLVEEIANMYNYVGHVSLYNYVNDKQNKQEWRVPRVPIKYLTLGVGEGADPYHNDKDAYTISLDGSVYMQQKRDRYTNFYCDLETFFDRGRVDVTNRPFCKKIAQYYLSLMASGEFSTPDGLTVGGEVPPWVQELILFLYDILNISIFAKVTESPAPRETIMDNTNMLEFWKLCAANDTIQNIIFTSEADKDVYTSEMLGLARSDENEFMQKVRKLVDEHNEKMPCTFEKIEIVSPVLKIDENFTTNIDRFMDLFDIKKPNKTDGSDEISTQTLANSLIIPLSFKLPTTECFYFHNSTSSCHVHVSPNIKLLGQEVNIFRAQPMTLCRVIYGWLLFEPVFFSLVPYWRRENDFCVPLRTILIKNLQRLSISSENDPWNKVWDNYSNFENSDDWKRIKTEAEPGNYDKLYTILLDSFQPDLKDDIKKVFTRGKNRYAAMNLLNAKHDGYGTVEFRIKHGSCDEIENMCFIRLFCKFVKYFVETSDMTTLTPEHLSLLKDLSFKPATAELRKSISKLATLPTTLYVMNNVINGMQGLELLLTTIGIEPALHDFFRRQFALVNQAEIQAYAGAESVARTTAQQAASALATLVTPIFAQGAVARDEMDVDTSEQNGQFAGGDASTLEESPIIQEETATDPLLPLPLEGGASSTLTGTRFPVFSYGSNSGKQLAQRTGAACLEPLPAYLNNWTRVFAGFSKFRQGGVASVYPLRGARVYGCVYELSKAEIDTLDGYEPGYSRAIKFVNVTLPDGKNKRVRAYVYVRDDQVYTHAPSLSYMQAIRAMLDDAKRAGTPRTKVHIRGVVLEDSGSGKKPHYAVKTYGHFFQNKVTMFKKPSVFKIDQERSSTTAMTPPKPKKNRKANNKPSPPGSPMNVDKA